MQLALTEQDIDVKLLQYYHLVIIHHSDFMVGIIQFTHEVGATKRNPPADAGSFFRLSLHYVYVLKFAPV